MTYAGKWPHAQSRTKGKGRGSCESHRGRGVSGSGPPGAVGLSELLCIHTLL